jgi:hypothetical protein
MTLLQHEIDFIADRILNHISGRLVELVRSTIREELKMTDQAVVDLTQAVNSAVAELGEAVTVIQSEANALAAALNANGATNDPAIETQVKRLTDATAAAAKAIAALSPPIESPGQSPAPGQLGSIADAPAVADLTA